MHWILKLVLVRHVEDVVDQLRRGLGHSRERVPWVGECGEITARPDLFLRVAVLEGVAEDVAQEVMLGGRGRADEDDDRPFFVLCKEGCLLPVLRVVKYTRSADF